MDLASRLRARSSGRGERGLKISIPVAVLTMTALFAWLYGKGIDFSSVSLPWLAVGAVLVAAMPVFTAVRWLILLDHMASIRGAFAAVMRSLFIVRFVGLFTSAIAADVAGRFAFAARHTGKKRLLAGSLIVDRGFDLALVGMMLPAGALLLFGAGTPLVGGALAVGLLAPIPLFFAWNRLPARLGVPPIGPRNYAVLWVLTASRWLLLAASTVAVAWAAGISASVLELLILTSLAQLAVIFAISPGGWGVLEAGWIGLLVAVGVDTSDAAMFALLQRAVQTASFGLCAMGALVLLRTARFLRDEDAAPKPSEPVRPPAEPAVPQDLRA